MQYRSKTVLSFSQINRGVFRTLLNIYDEVEIHLLYIIFTQVTKLSQDQQQNDTIIRSNALPVASVWDKLFGYPLAFRSSMKKVSF